jgi:hypothetical protein
MGLELLELISSDPDDETCVVIVDDAHLIDTGSLRALLFAARRRGRQLPDRCAHGLPRQRA